MTKICSVCGCYWPAERRFVSHPKIYNRALSETEIKTLFMKGENEVKKKKVRKKDRSGICIHCKKHNTNVLEKLLEEKQYMLSQHQQQFEAQKQFLKQKSFEINVLKDLVVQLEKVLDSMKKLMLGRQQKKKK